MPAACSCAGQQVVAFLVGKWRISTAIGDFDFDLRILAWMIGLAVLFAGGLWLRAHPQHNPLATLDITQKPGIATQMQFHAVVENREACRAVLTQGGADFAALSPIGDGPCALVDRTQVQTSILSPAQPVSTCPVAAGMEVWLRHGLQDAARQYLGTEVKRIEHLGVISCRRVNSSPTGPWSEHATGNAIDIAAFVMGDGRRISVLDYWGKGKEGAFLKAARDAACDSFKTVMSPDYNAQHRNHFHLDQGTRWAMVCR